MPSPFHAVRTQGSRVSASPTTANLVNLNFQAQSRWQVSMRGEWRATGQDGRLAGSHTADPLLVHCGKRGLAAPLVPGQTSATLPPPWGKNFSSHDYCYLVQ
ncbi:hypothetical protein E2C01_083799 [Portunus trituberculatus]|uniref:Uncharacterized protein n=1 Tax=Portunus trituberculatus TaxID=210409 RepID=A0A5B7J4L2_PORTR|nr:hypothetical protein [Portunus trituberculatus]